MGDRYQRERYQPDYDRDRRDHDRDYRPRDDYYSRDQYQSNYHEQDRHQSDNYRPQSYNDRERDNGGYTFRGAAERETQQYRAQDNFTFTASGPPAPRFSPDPRPSFPQPQQGRARVETSRRRLPPGSRPRGAAANGYRGRGGFRARPAHNRDILSKTGRDTTPELLEGMYIDGERRFREVDSSSDAMSENGADPDVIDLTRDDSEVDDQPRKRTKVSIHSDSAVPKWSNPDPYTALPPPEATGGPKKDIVQVIRKAKVDAMPKADGQDAAKENADFISLNFDDDFGASDESDAGVSLQPQPNAPKAPSGFSHREQFHEKLGSTRPTQQPQSSSQAPTNRQLPTEYYAGAPPGPPPGLIMPTYEEMLSQSAGRGQGKKRKHDAVKARPEYDIVEEWEPHHAVDPTPWSNARHYNAANAQSSKLHKEICEFHDFVRPYQYEEAVRQELIKRIERAMRQAGTRGAESVQVKCFGSFAAGLYLPTADMDLVAVSPDYLRTGRRSFCQSATQMHRIANHLVRVNIASPDGLAVISRSKVPIIKFIDQLTGIKVDISFENDSGLLANETFETWKFDFPAMPVVVVLIKQLLAMRGLNEVFSGGIGGFTIICLVVSMMQHMPDLQSGHMDPDQSYDELLLNFLDLYGNKFNLRTTGIIMDPPGYFNKVNEPRAMQNANRLTIMDPNRPDNDISGGSSRIDAVFDCFRYAHSALEEQLERIEKGLKVEDSILGSVWGGDYTSFIRQREKLSLLHRGYGASPPPPPQSPPPPPPPTRSAPKSLPKAAPIPAPKTAPVSAPTASKSKGKASKNPPKPLQSKWKQQPMAFVPAQDSSLPIRPSAQPQHPLPARPAANNGAESASTQPVPLTKKQKKLAAKHEKIAAENILGKSRAKLRAQQLQALHPNLSIPNKLNKAQFKALTERIDADITKFVKPT